MRFAFLRSLSPDHFKETFLRFPLAILSSAGASGLMLWMTYTEASMNYSFDSLQRWMISCFLGILLFTGLSLFAERHRLRSWLIQLLGIPVLYALVYCVNPQASDVSAISYGLVFLGSLALIFSGPYLFSKEDKGFWLFSVRVWNRAMLAIATAIIVVVALELALVSIETLFQLVLDYRWEESIPEIFFVFVPTLVFLMGIPSNYKELEKSSTTLSFRSFGAYLFAPLLGVYFLILATYVLKVLVTQVWPDGFVAMPILVFSTIGFAMLALIFPLLAEKENHFLHLVNRLFLWSSPVFSVVYFVALWKRIDQYGITEMRYLGVVLGLLILGWALYFGWFKKARLKVIPSSLFVVAFLVSFGPWGVFQTSERNQLSRLEALMTEHGLLVNGSIVPSTDEAVGLETEVALSSSFDYLVNNYGEESVAEWFGGIEKVDGVGAYGLMEQLGLSYHYAYEYGYPVDSRYYYFNSDDSSVENITGYQYRLHYYYYGYEGGAPEDSDRTVILDKNTSAFFHYNDVSQALEVTVNGKMLSLAVTDFINQLKTDYSDQDYIDRENFVLSGEKAGLSVKIYFNSLSFQESDEEGFENLNIDGDLLIRLK